WFRDTSESVLYINEVAVRIRAGILLMIPLYMGLTLFDVLYTSSWIVDPYSVIDSYDTDFDGRIIYSVEAVKRTYDYTVQTWVLCYALFDMLAGMSLFTSRLSPSILLSSYLARNSAPIWKPLVPKRFAWSIGGSMIVLCILYFNPDSFAFALNALWGSELLPETENYLPNWIPSLIWVCLAFMWLEAILGFCAGCKLHSLLVWTGLFKEECVACNNINWEEIAHRQKQSSS
ncbi:MAG: DUF4395 family protein, partial [Thiomicrorhabdus sp.]|nr:DUF4395 family protein [Thiomicrorhabdus sp.]